MWHNIETQDDIEMLMSSYRDFHDSCIVSVNYLSGSFINKERAMHCGKAEDHVMSVVFHSQWTPRIIELQFAGLRQCHLVGWEHNYFMKFHVHI